MAGTQGAAAIYLRLSRQDGDLGNGKDESNSIENQRLLLLGYLVDHPDIAGEVREYVDDGFTGTNFDRPGFMSMIDDAKQAVVQTIVVKDFSRLGRDYIGVGDYVEQIFPLLGIRFIAVNNNFDSSKYGANMGLGIALDNLVNSYYVKDIAKKRRSANEVMWKRGYATVSRVPYGYYWDTRNKGKWELDPVSSQYVRKIFDLALEEKSTSIIAFQMNLDGIPTPGRYAQERMANRTPEEKNCLWAGGVGRAPKSEQLWTGPMVWRILTRYEYTGALVSNQYQTLKLGKETRRRLPEQDNIITKGAHEAIITEEEFEQAQHVIRNKSKKSYSTVYDYPLKGKVFCGNCRRSLLYREDAGGAVFLCIHRRNIGAMSKCSNALYPEAAMNARVHYAIRKLVEIAGILEMKLEEKNLPSAMMVGDAKKYDGKIAGLKAERIRQYEGYASGMITRTEYLRIKDEINRQIEELEAEAEKLNEFLKEEESVAEGIREIGEKGRNFEEQEEQLCRKSLTKEMVDAFVDAVYIYDESRMEVVFRCEDVIRKAIDKLVDEDGVLRL